MIFFLPLRDFVLCVCLAAVGLWLSGCDAGLVGAGGGADKSFSGGHGSGEDDGIIDAGPGAGGPGLGESQGGAGPGSGWPTNPHGRQDVPIDYGDDDETLYVPAQFYYNGDYSGSDALFTFYMQRITPAPMRQMKEIIQAKGDKVSSSNSVEKFCRCGQRNEFFFYWEHKHGRKGALHSPVYDQDNRLMGDWIIGNNVVGEGANQWYTGNLTKVPQGAHSFFFGADTENPAALMGVNPEGVGYLRTWFYHPNSGGIFATKDHVWHARDDMRIGMSCQISQCPANLQQNTSVTVRAHFSHTRDWIRP